MSILGGAEHRPDPRAAFGLLQHSLARRSRDSPGILPSSIARGPRYDRLSTSDVLLLPPAPTFGGGFEPPDCAGPRRVRRRVRHSSSRRSSEALRSPILARALALPGRRVRRARLEAGRNTPRPEAARPARQIDGLADARAAAVGAAEFRREGHRLGTEETESRRPGIGDHALTNPPGFEGLLWPLRRSPREPGSPRQAPCADEPRHRDCKQYVPRLHAPEIQPSQECSDSPSSSRIWRTTDVTSGERL